MELLLSQQLCLLSTELSQLLGLLRALLVKQSYFLPFSDKFILDEPGYSGMLLVSVKRLQHGANGGLAYGRAHSPYRTPFEVTQMVKPFTCWVKGFFTIHHVHDGWCGRWKDYKVLPGVTGHTLA